MATRAESRFFVATPDMIDVLKAEFSASKPEHHGNITRATLEMQDILEGKYWDFIPTRTTTRTRGLERRIIVFDTPTTFQTFINLWTKVRKPDSRFETAEGCSLRIGNLIVFYNPQAYWDEDYFNENLKASLRERFSDEQTSRSIGVSLLFWEYLAHEIAHQYEGIIPRLLSECGARYYAREIITAMGYHTLSADKLHEERIKFFADLIDGVGNDVHRIFFGSRVPKNVKEDIFLCCDDTMANRLFPGGKGL